MHLLSFPESGWVLGVLLRQPVSLLNQPIGLDDEYHVGQLPVVAMCVLDGEIEPVVALQDGRILPISRTDFEVLCLAAPGEDVKRIAMAALALRLEEKDPEDDTALAS